VIEFYRQSLQPEFSVLKVSTGNFYHQMGNYYLLRERKRLTPVNRSYVIDVNGNRRCEWETKAYHKNPLIHERVTKKNQLINPETLVNIYGKPYLYIADNDCVWFSSTEIGDKRISAYAREILDESREGLERLSVSYMIGIYGSHRIGLNSIGSDIDLALWTVWENRGDVIKTVTESLRNREFLTSGEQGKDIEYAARYAKRFGVSNLAGWYLAKKRIRFIDSHGLSVSLQCLNTELNNEQISSFFRSIDEEWVAEEIDTQCEVVSSKTSYNFPKVWNLQIGGDILSAVSLSWMHQGMGDDNGEFGNRYRLRASLVHTEEGEFIYLRDHSHFIIPANLL